MSNLNEIIAGVGNQAHNRVTFDGSTGKVGNFTLFNVTGIVAVKVYATVEVDLTGSGSLEIGTAITTGGILPTTTGTALDAGEIWQDNSPDASVELSSTVAEKIVSQNIIATVSSATITAGRILFTVIWKPISQNAYLEAVNLGGSASPSVSPSASISPSSSVSPSSSASSSISASISPSSSVSPSSSRSPSASASLSLSPSASVSPSSSASASRSPSSSASASISPSSSISPSPSPSA